MNEILITVIIASAVIILSWSMIHLTERVHHLEQQMEFLIHQYVEKPAIRKDPRQDNGPRRSYR